MDERPLDFSQNVLTAGSDPVCFLHLSGFIFKTESPLISEHAVFNKDLVNRL
jgi:hypothetical protein